MSLTQGAVIVDRVAVEDISDGGFDTSWANGDIHLAVNMNGAQTTLGDATFIPHTATSSSDVTFFGLVNEHAWPTAIEFGSTAALNALEVIVSAGMWAPSGNIGFTLHSVPVGYWRITLPQVERCCDRGFSIVVNSVVHYSCFNSYRLDGQDADDGHFIVIDLHQTVANEDIQIYYKTGCGFPDNNPTLHAFAVKALDDDYFNQPVYVDNSQQICPLHQFSDLCVCDASTLGSVTENPIELESLETRVEAGNLIIVFNEPRKYRYKWANRPDIALLDKAGEEDPDAYLKCYSKFSWTVDDSATACDGVRKWTGTAKMTDVFNGDNGCQHAAPVVGEIDDVPVDILTLFLTVQNAETVELVSGDSDDQTGTGTGSFIQREVTHAIPFQVAFEKEIDVSVSGVEAYSKVVTARAVVAQIAGYVEGSTSTAYVDVDVYTNVQHPFKFQYNGARPALHTNGGLTVGTPTALSLDDYTCLDQDNSNCETVFRVRFTDNAGQCNFDGDFTVTLDVVCNLASPDDCPLDGSETVTISFTLDSPDHVDTGGSCAAVALQDVQLENEFKSYKGTDFNNDSEDNFIDGDTMVFRAEIWSPSTSLKSAILSDVTISGGNIVTPIKLFENGFVVNSADSVWGFTKTDDLNKETDPTTDSSRLFPFFAFSARAEDMSVSTRDRSTVTVTAVYDLVYTAELSTSSSSSGLRTERVVVKHTLSDDTSSALKSSADVGVRGKDAAPATSTSGVDVASGSNIAFISVCVVTGLMVLVALVVFTRRASNKRKEASFSSVEVEDVSA